MKNLRFDFPKTYKYFYTTLISISLKVTHWNLKRLILLFSLTAFSFVSYSQTDTIFKKDISKYLITRYNLYSFKKPSRYSIPALNYSVEQRKIQSRFSLYDSPNKGQVIYDNYRREYFPINNYNYNQNLKDAFIGGAIDYLFLLLDKKGKFFDTMN